jgi:hypothetical protein
LSVYRWYIDVNENLPSVTCGVDSRERNTAIHDLEVWLVFEHKLPYNARGNSLGEANYCIVVDYSTALEADRRSDDSTRGCEELNSEFEHGEFCWKTNGSGKVAV